ncbi:MAG: hypothetical protein KAG61_08355 [Bacteriovoracaceae bacterium]|nr:hypothetical protein [Bacteriovoracaceae bacterium]
MATSELVRKYPPRIKSPLFKKYWEQFLNDIAVRDNFKDNHLAFLHILCELLVEYEGLQDVLRVYGPVVEHTTAHGVVTHKVRPEVLLRDKVLVEIRNYSKLLKVGLFEDTQIRNKKDPEDDWA